jgi:hypothetical protein
MMQRTINSLRFAGSWRITLMLTLFINLVALRGVEPLLILVRSEGDCPLPTEPQKIGDPTGIRTQIHRLEGGGPVQLNDRVKLFHGSLF